MPETHDEIARDHDDHDEHHHRRRTIRREILGVIAGVLLLGGPILFANTVAEDDADAATASEPVSNTRALQSTTTTASPTTTAAPETTTTTAAPAPAPETTTTTAAPAPVASDVTPDSGGAVPDPYSYATWDTLAECESTSNWAINTGNGYYGGVQFSLSSWRAVGGTGYPHEASRETQITMAIRLWEIQGWVAWPACTAELGWR